jgi:DNA processing protein
VTNREVYAVPGNITSRNSFGTNFLIKGAGAKLVQQWQDVAAEFPPEIAAALLPPEVKEKGAGKRKSEAPLPSDLSDGERSLMKLLSSDEATHIDSLAESGGLSVQELSVLLLGLEMRDLIRQLPGRCFVRKI